MAVAEIYSLEFLRGVNECTTCQLRHNNLATVERICVFYSFSHAITAHFSAVLPSLKHWIWPPTPFGVPSLCLPLSAANTNEASFYDSKMPTKSGAERGMFWVHFKALVAKRATYGMRDKKSMFFQLVVPTLLFLLGLILLRTG